MEVVSVFIVDAHEDIAYNALHNDRDVRSSVVRTRQVEAAMLGRSARKSFNSLSCW